MVACTLLVGALGSTDCTIKTLTIKDQKGRSVSLAQTWNSAIFTGWTSEVANDVESITVASTRPGSGAYVYTYSSSFGSGASTARGQKATDVASSTIPLEVTQGTSCNYVQIVVTCSCKNTYLLKFCRKPPSGTKGDPIFSGLLGQGQQQKHTAHIHIQVNKVHLRSVADFPLCFFVFLFSEFQIHGVANEVYNVISDPVMQMNSRFVFLDHGACPILNGRRAHACWSHPGSYLGEIGIKTNGGDRVHISSGSARHGFKRITLNGRDLEYDEVMPIASDNSVWNNQSSTDLLRSDDSYDNLMDSWIVRNSTHLVTVQLSNYIFQIENSDHFLN